jgi:hypothetical protein
MSELAVGSLKGLAANSFVIDVASGSKIVQPGSILQVVSVTKTDTFTTTSGTYGDVTGLTATITPSSTSSKILVMVYLLAGNATNLAGFHTRIVRDSTAIFVGDSSGSKVQASFGNTVDANQNGFAGSPISLDSPNTTSAVTYKIQARVGSGGTLAIGRVGAEVSDDATRPRVPSSITLLEVAG